MLAAPSDDQVRAILRKHGLPDEVAIERSAHEGSVNHVRMAGEYCVRLLKEPNYASDIWTESVAVPAVRASGVKTPELIAFDPAADHFPGLVTIYRREPGDVLGQFRGPVDLARIYREIGEQIGTWHRGVRRIEDPFDRLDKPELGSIRQGLVRNSVRMSQAEIQWADDQISRLEAAGAGPRGFVHWDLHAHNVLISDGRLSSILDWGDAGWGDAAINFHCFPAQYLPEALEGFGDPTPELFARCLLGVLGYALNDIYHPDDALQPYRNSGHRRWKSLQALYQRDLPPEWRQWMSPRIQM